MPPDGDDLPSGLTMAEFSSWIFRLGAAAGPGPRGIELAPFRAVRFSPRVVGDLAHVTAPPYDVIDERDVTGLMREDGHNIVRLIRPRGAAAPAESAAPGENAAATGNAADRYRGARETLRRWLADGALDADADEALWIYEIAAGGLPPLQRGLIGALRLRPETDRVILPHEDVHPAPVRDRLALMSATAANLEPIFLVYEGDGTVDAVLDKVTAAPPVIETATEDGLVHRLWPLADPAGQAAVAAGLRGRSALIADGHHRYATYLALQARHHARGDGPGPWDHGLAMLVDSTVHPPQLAAIHRVLPGLPPELAAARAARFFQVREFPAGRLDEALAALAEAVEGSAAADPATEQDEPRPDQRPAFLLAGGDRSYLLTDPDPDALALATPPGESAVRGRLSTAVLDRLLIERAWDLPAGAVEVTHDPPEAAVERARRTAGTAVLLQPLRRADVLAVAAAGERVPRKSTSFGPKPRSGLVLRLLDLG